MTSPWPLLANQAWHRGETGPGWVTPRPVLRSLRAGDRPAIAAIVAAIPAFRAEDEAIALELVDEALDPTPDTDYAWMIADRAGQVVGFACFGPVPLTDGTFDLYWIAVAPDATRRGIAARLDAAVTLAVRGQPGARWLLAETSSTADYVAAQTFYRRQGYRLVGRIADYYRPGDDRLTYGKRLDEDAPHVSD